MDSSGTKNGKDGCFVVVKVINDPSMLKKEHVYIHIYIYISLVYDFRKHSTG